MSDQVFYLFSAVLLGLVIGAMLMYFASGKGANSTKTAELEEKLSNYQQNVVEHFEKTADLVDDLTQSYKKVFDHLGESAKELMSEEQLQLQIEKRKGRKVTLEFLPNQVTDTDAIVEEIENNETAEIQNSDVELMPENEEVSLDDSQDKEDKEEHSYS